MGRTRIRSSRIPDEGVTLEETRLDPVDRTSHVKGGPTSASTLQLYSRKYAGSPSRDFLESPCSRFRYVRTGLGSGLETTPTDPVARPKLYGKWGEDESRLFMHPSARDRSSSFERVGSAFGAILGELNRREQADRVGGICDGPVSVDRCSSRSVSVESAVVRVSPYNLVRVPSTSGRLEPVEVVGFSGPAGRPQSLEGPRSSARRLRFIYGGIADGPRWGTSRRRLRTRVGYGVGCRRQRPTTRVGSTRGDYAYGIFTVGTGVPRGFYVSRGRRIPGKGVEEVPESDEGEGAMYSPGPPHRRVGHEGGPILT